MCGNPGQVEKLLWLNSGDPFSTLAAIHSLRLVWHLLDKIGPPALSPLFLPPHRDRTSNEPLKPHFYPAYIFLWNGNGDIFRSKGYIELVWLGHGYIINSMKFAIYLLPFFQSERNSTQIVILGEAHSAVHSSQLRVEIEFNSGNFWRKASPLSEICISRSSPKGSAPRSFLLTKFISRSLIFKLKLRHFRDSWASKFTLFEPIFSGYTCSRWLSNRFEGWGPVGTKRSFYQS